MPYLLPRARSSKRARSLRWVTSKTLPGAINSAGKMLLRATNSAGKTPPGDTVASVLVPFVGSLRQ